jgi:hypothetical protein
MKKQLFTLALLTLGYVASSHSMGVAVLAHLTKFKETMAVGTTQKVNAVAAYIVPGSEKPKVHGQEVIKLEETKEGVWTITTLNPGMVSVVLEKKKSGYTNQFHAAEHDLTVTGAPKGKKKQVKDVDGLMVESIQNVLSDKDIVVDEIEMDSADSHMEMNAEGEVEDDVMRDVE